MSSLSADASLVDPTTAPKDNQQQDNGKATNPNRNAGDTDDASNEELESLEKTDENNLATHPDDVDSNG